MSLSAAEVWSRLLDRARQELPAQTFRTWLEPTEALSVDEKTIVVGAPDQFAADWNDSKHSALLASYAPVALGHPLSVVFKVHEETRARPQMDFFVAPTPAEAAKVAAEEQQKRGTSLPLSDRYTFEHFVVGSSNDMAYAASHAVAQSPGRTYNPLFLYGDTGLGKTHLMQAIAHELVRKNPATRVTFVGSEQFTNELIAAIQSRTMQDFKRRYRETDILLVDDVQFLKGKETTQEEFFHTFNAIYEAGRQIVLTSDRPPNDIPGLEARLVSRFEWGMVASIGFPDVEHRVAILRKKLQLDHLEVTIPDDVVHFVAENVRSSVRELEGALIKLLAYASLKHREITVEVAREALRDKLRFTPMGGVPAVGGGPGVSGPSSGARGLSVAVIQDAAAAEFGVTAEGLKSKTRTKTLTTPRQVAMYLCRELLALQLVEIGNAFGGRDHSTVIHSLERVNDEMKEDETFRGRVLKLRGMLETLRG
jgi:chromosomal replication initiator protein